MTVITIEVISDIVCIWCFIGKRTIEKAIAIYQKTYPGGKDDTFSVIWRPYYLNYSHESRDKAELAKERLKDVKPEKMAAMRNRVDQVARANGIEFKFGGRIGSTRDAHRLVHLSQLHASTQVQDNLVEGLFQAFHEKEMDISDRNVLTAIAKDAGLDDFDVDKWLASDQAVSDVDYQAQQNREHVTTGVPTFLIQGTHRVDGAQDLQEFFEAFVQVKEAEQGNSA